MRQIVRGEVFYTLPGGHWEEGETLEETCRREIKEEFNVDVKVGKLVFLLDTKTRIAFYFLCDYLGGKIALGGPEKARMNNDEQYFVEWVSADRIQELDMIPRVVKEGLLGVLAGNNKKLFLLAG